MRSFTEKIKQGSNALFYFWWRRGESLLACGLGHGAALKPHCGFIHHRAEFDSPFPLQKE